MEEVGCVRSTVLLSSSQFICPLAPAVVILMLNPQHTHQNRAPPWSLPGGQKVGVMVIQDTALGGRTGFLVEDEYGEGGWKPPLSHTPLQNLYKELSVVSKCHSDMPLGCFRPDPWPQSHSHSGTHSLDSHSTSLPLLIY